MHNKNDRISGQSIVDHRSTRLGERNDALVIFLILQVYSEGREREAGSIRDLPLNPATCLPQLVIFERRPPDIEKLQPAERESPLNVLKSLRALELLVSNLLVHSAH